MKALNTAKNALVAGILTLAIPVQGFAAVTGPGLSVVSDGDPLTSSAWNAMVNEINAYNAPNKIMRQHSDGKVGIGTSAPGAPLEVVANGGGWAEGIIIRPVASTGYNAVFFRDDTTGTDGWSFGRTPASDRITLLRAGLGGMEGTHRVDSVFDVQTNGNAVFGGRVGIGESNPGVLLHMTKNNGDALINIEQSGNGNSSGINFLRERSSGPGVTGGSIFMDSNTSSSAGLLYIQAQSASAHAGVTGDLTDGNGARVIVGNGKVDVDEGSLIIKNNGKFYDDGNFHIHSSAQPMWINAEDGSAVNLNAQYAGNVTLANGGGNVGIGTNPVTKLHIKQDANTEFRFASNLWGTNAGGNFHIDADGSKSNGGIYLNFFDGKHVYVGNGASGINAIFRQDGKVGIGDSTPDGSLLLDVEGAIGASQLCDQNGANCSSVATLSAGVSPWTKNGSHINYTAGSVSMGTTTPFGILHLKNTGTNADIDVASPSITLTNQNGTYTAGDYYGVMRWSRPNSNGGTPVAGIAARTGATASEADLVFYTQDGANNDRLERMTITNAGYVGIGTTNPSVQLQVESGNSNSASVLIRENDTTAGLGLKLVMAGNNAVVGNSANGFLRFDTNNTERIRINANGNVGIGTTTPTEKLHVVGGSIQVDNARGLHFGGIDTRIQGNDTTDQIDLYTGGGIRMSVDSSGNVGIGTTTPATGLHVQSSGAGSLRTLRLAYDGTYYADIAQLGAGGLSYNAVGGAFHIWKNNGTEVMRIRNDGHVGIGTSAPAGLFDVAGSFYTNGGIVNIRAQDGTNEGGQITVLGAGANDTFHIDNFNGDARSFWIDGNHHTFDIRNYGSGVANMGVEGSVTATSFNYSSDQNLKKDISTLINPIETVKSLRGVDFNWKETGKKDVGFIAQEVEEVLPELVHTNEESGMKSVQYGNIVPVLVEALKEQQEQIDALREELELLK